MLWVSRCPSSPYPPDDSKPLVNPVMASNDAVQGRIQLLAVIGVYDNLHPVVAGLAVASEEHHDCVAGVQRKIGR